MDGIFINGIRPKSKKAIKEAIAINPDSVRVEITSLFSPNSGRTLRLSECSYPIHFVGPDPHTKRNFYGTIHSPTKVT